MYLLVFRLKHNVPMFWFRFFVSIFHLKTAVPKSQGIGSLLVISLTIQNQTKVLDTFLLTAPVILARFQT